MDVKVFKVRRSAKTFPHRLAAFQLTLAFIQRLGVAKCIGKMNEDLDKKLKQAQEDHRRMQSSFEIGKVFIMFSCRMF